jgi:hypothetical protein
MAGFLNIVGHASTHIADPNKTDVHDASPPCDDVFQLVLCTAKGSSVDRSDMTWPYSVRTGGGLMPACMSGSNGCATPDRIHIAALALLYAILPVKSKDEKIEICKNAQAWWVGTRYTIWY